MVFLLLSVVVPFVIYFGLPRLFTACSTRPDVTRWPLALGGFLYFVSYYLPSPLIEGQNTAFSTHFVGGGIFTGFVWLYLKRRLGWKLGPVLEILSLYALVSALGAANELFELGVAKAQLARLDPSDTWWDLLANTLGAATFWIGYRAGIGRSERG